MALCCSPSLPSVIRPRRYPPINPLPAGFFHRVHFSVSLKNFVTRSMDCNGSAHRISVVCARVDAASTEEMSPSSSRIFVKGLSRSTSEGYLLKQFSQFGEISKVKIITSRGSKESLGMAYIWFACTESIQLAIKEMNGKFVDGRFIAVMMSRPEAPTKQRRKRTLNLCEKAKEGEDDGLELPSISEVRRRRGRRLGTTALSDDGEETGAGLGRHLCGKFMLLAAFLQLCVLCTTTTNSIQ